MLRSGPELSGPLQMSLPRLLLEILDRCCGGDNFQGLKPRARASSITPRFIVSVERPEPLAQQIGSSSWPRGRRCGSWKRSTRDQRRPQRSDLVPSESRLRRAEAAGSSHENYAMSMTQESKRPKSWRSAGSGPTGRVCPQLKQ